MMRILAVSDEECPALWDYYRPGRLDGYDLILSAGDLKADYLSFLVTMAHAPLLYVHGNHDEGYARRPPEGCDCIDDRLVVYRGWRILGLGGCLQYRPDAPLQFTERQMARRIARLRLALLRRKPGEAPGPVSSPVPGPRSRTSQGLAPAPAGAAVPRHPDRQRFGAV